MAKPLIDIIRSSINIKEREGIKKYRNNNFTEAVQLLWEAREQRSLIKNPLRKKTLGEKSFSALSKSLFNTGNFGDASTVLHEAVESYPRNHLFLKNLAYSLNALGKFKEAKDYLRGVDIAMNTYDPSIACSYYKNLGCSLLGQGKLDLAKEVLDDAIRKRHSDFKEDYLPAYALRGDAHRLMGEFEEARQDYEIVKKEFLDLRQKKDAHISTEKYLAAIRAIRGLTIIGGGKNLITDAEKSWKKEAIEKGVFSSTLTVENYFRHFK